jgi:hypothetical protein
VTRLETHPEDVEFLRAWSADVGTPGYDKRDWQRRQAELYARIYRTYSANSRLVSIPISDQGDAMTPALDLFEARDESAWVPKHPLTASVHATCGGLMTMRQVTSASCCLSCPCCYLRVLYPVECKTFTELRTWMVKRFVQEREGGFSTHEDVPPTSDPAWGLLGPYPDPRKRGFLWSRPKVEP